jgi:hypothetical protein
MSIAARLKSFSACWLCRPTCNVCRRPWRQRRPDAVLAPRCGLHAVQARATATAGIDWKTTAEQLDAKSPLEIMDHVRLRGWRRSRQLGCQPVALPNDSCHASWAMRGGCAAPHHGAGNPPTLPPPPGSDLAPPIPVARPRPSVHQPPAPRLAAAPAGAQDFWHRRRHRLLWRRGCGSHRVRPPDRPPLHRLQVRRGARNCPRPPWPCVAGLGGRAAAGCSAAAATRILRRPGRSRSGAHLRRPLPASRPGPCLLRPRCPRRSLDTGRLNPETYQLFDAVEKHYGIKINYTFPDAQARAAAANIGGWGVGGRRGRQGGGRCQGVGPGESRVGGAGGSGRRRGGGLWRRSGRLRRREGRRELGCWSGPPRSAAGSS